MEQLRCSLVVLVITLVAGACLPSSSEGSHAKLRIESFDIPYNVPKIDPDGEPRGIGPASAYIRVEEQVTSCQDDHCYLAEFHLVSQFLPANAESMNEMWLSSIFQYLAYSKLERAAYVASCVACKARRAGEATEGESSDGILDGEKAQRPELWAPHTTVSGGTMEFTRPPPDFELDQSRGLCFFRGVIKLVNSEKCNGNERAFESVFPPWETMLKDRSNPDALWKKDGVLARSFFNECSRDYDAFLIKRKAK